MSLANTHPDFRETIKRLATVAATPPDAIYEKWIIYAQDCADQNRDVLLADFVRLWKDRLGGDLTALTNALNKSPQPKNL